MKLVAETEYYFMDQYLEISSDESNVDTWWFIGGKEIEDIFNFGAWK
jgi:hypothetical protein